MTPAATISNGEFLHGRVDTKPGITVYKLESLCPQLRQNDRHLAVVVNIREQVSVAHGGGTFSARSLLDVYPYDAATGTTGSTPIQSIAV